jgi:hypothetical protein
MCDILINNFKFTVLKIYKIYIIEIIKIDNNVEKAGLFETYLW